MNSTCFFAINIYKISSSFTKLYSVLFDSNFMSASLMFSCFIYWSFSSLIFLNIQLNRFLTLFSVRPGNNLTISDHLFPILFLKFNIWRSSSIENESLLISGLRKLYHLSLHCFPFLLTLSFKFNSSAISYHYLVPFLAMILNSSSSSLFYH